MKESKLAGIVLLVIGVGVLIYAFNRAWYHPTSEDRKRLAMIADYGQLADPGNPLKIYFMGGAILTGWGIKKLGG